MTSNSTPASFVHLHLHTEYSLVDGLVRLKPLMKAAAAMNMPALAITDYCNMFAAVKFQKGAAGAGIKPIFGSDVLVEGAEKDDKPFLVVLLAQNLQGYRNLTQIVSEAYLTGQGTGRPVVKREFLAERSEGLIALSGGKQGEIGRALLNDNVEVAELCLQEMQAMFPNRFYLELQRTGRNEDETYLHQAVELATKHNVPVVATNDVHFISKDEFDAHDVRVCIREGWTVDTKDRAHAY
ncbi:MAG: DNA polymerase III subunit alpha, partial [Moraxellaceae bacterium]